MTLLQLLTTHSTPLTNFKVNCVKSQEEGIKMSKIYQKITDLIGGTPLLELANYEKKNNLEATVSWVDTLTLPVR